MFFEELRGKGKKSGWRLASIKGKERKESKERSQTFSDWRDLLNVKC